MINGTLPDEDWGIYGPSYETEEFEFGTTSKADTSGLHRLISASVITGLGIFVNSFIVILFVCRRDIRTLSFVAVALLAIADLVRNASPVLLIVGQAMKNWTFGDSLCKLTRYLHFCSSVVSVYQLVLLVVVRYGKTFHETSYVAKLPNHRLLLVSLILWLFVIVTAIPVVISYTTWEIPYSEPKVIFCIFQADLEKSRSLIISDATVRLLIPLLVLTIFGGLALCQTRRPAHPHVRCARVITILTPIYFILLQLPVHAIAVVFHVLVSRNMFLDQDTLTLHEWADLISYCTTVFNPFLQAFTSCEFRMVISGWFTCGKSYDTKKAEKRAQSKMIKANAHN